MANNKVNTGTVIEEQSAIIAELKKHGMVADDSEIRADSSSIGLKTHEGTMYVTKDGKVHLTFDAIAFETLTNYENKQGQVTARRVALRFKSESGAPIKVPIAFTTSTGETVPGYYMLRTVHCGAVSLYPIASK